MSFTANGRYASYPDKDVNIIQSCLNEDLRNYVSATG